MTVRKKKKHDDNALREHSFDGIHEFDKRLPNWWLFTLYGAIAFAAAYWFVYFHPGGATTDIEHLNAEMARIEAANLADASGLTDDDLWKMAGNPVIIADGKKTYESICVACHGPNMEGGIGFPLIKNVWVHGGNPSDLVKTVTFGVPEKGMQPWGPTLGSKKVAEVVAYILSKNNRETMQAEPSAG
jgi:cytochrome c oxidase cbb3-type subunit 3